MLQILPSFIKIFLILYISDLAILLEFDIFIVFMDFLIKR